MGFNSGFKGLNVDQLFLEWEMFQSKFVEKIKTQILCSITPAPPGSENRTICKKMWKNMVQSDNRAWKSNAALKNAIWMPDNKGKKNTDTLS